jgi:hypothetical protein
MISENVMDKERRNRLINLIIACEKRVTILYKKYLKDHGNFKKYKKAEAKLILLRKGEYEGILKLSI